MLQAVVNGLMVGASFALLALGYTLVFGVMHLLTLAHGTVFMASGLMALVLAGPGTPFWLVGLYAITIGAVLSVATDVLCFRPVGYHRPIAAAVATIGLAIAIESATIQLRGSATPVAASFPIPSTDFHVGALLISSVQATGFAIAIIVMIVTHLFVRRTKWGMAMRAFAHDAETVQVLGIPTRLLTASTLAIAGGLAGLSAYLIILRSGSISSLSGLQFGLTGLAVMTIGGLGSLPGAMIAGLALGLIESVASYLGLTGYQAAVPWALLIVVLLVRPHGLLGRPVGER